MWAAILADIVMTIHFAFLAYLVIGGFFAWKWPMMWFPHAIISFYALAIVYWNFTCPLTPIEHDLRLRAGQQGLESGGFLGTYIEGVIYPAEHIMTIRWAVGILIGITWVIALFFLLRHRERQRQERLKRDAEERVIKRRFSDAEKSFGHKREAKFKEDSTSDSTSDGTDEGGDVSHH